MKGIGLVEELKFHIYKGKSFNLDVLWWYDESKTLPAIIESARGKIQTQDSGGDDIINLSPTFTGNRVLVRLSPVQTLAIVQDSGYLELEASTAVETKLLIHGRVRIHQEVSE